jgi:hypothetical protein
VSIVFSIVNQLAQALERHRVFGDLIEQRASQVAHKASSLSLVATRVLDAMAVFDRRNHDAAPGDRVPAVQ